MEKKFVYIYGIYTVYIYRILLFLFLGIVVRKGNGQFPQFFKWNDITNLVNHKRYVVCDT